MFSFIFCAYIFFCVCLFVQVTVVFGGMCVCVSVCVFIYLLRICFFFARTLFFNYFFFKGISYVSFLLVVCVRVCVFIFFLRMCFIFCACVCLFVQVQCELCEEGRFAETTKFKKCTLCALGQFLSKGHIFSLALIQVHISLIAGFD